MKCIEQLLFHIVCFAKGKELQIKSTNIKLDDGTKLPPKVDFSTTSLDNGWCDTTLGSLTTFLNESKSHIISNKKSKGCIYNCLKCFIRECRNESFHKHNIRNWSRVEIIRNNTIILIELLLGCCKLGETQQETDKDLQIIRNDRFERAYCWITSVPADSFYVVFNDESPVHVKMGLSSEYPRFSDYGLISDYLISLDNIESEGPRQRVIGNIQIGRNRTPDKMWYLDSCGNKVEWDQ